MAPDDYFLFLRCSMPIGKSGECPGCGYLERDDLRPDHDVFDMSLLLVSQMIRDEASAIMFSRNHFWFPERLPLHDFGRNFPDYAKHMQMVSFRDIFDESHVERRIDTFQCYGRRMRKDFLAVKALTIYVRVRDTNKTNRPVFEEGILNYFRPLSSLPLSQAHVKLSVCYGGGQRISQEMLKMLCTKAESILLLDASLPEQEMQRLPQDADPGNGTNVPAIIVSNPDWDLSCADCSQAWFQGSHHATRSMMDGGLPCCPSLACVSLRFEARY
jgi:hypothetical protein